VKFLTYLRPAPILIPLIIGIIRFKDLRNLKYVFYFVAYGTVNEIASKILVKTGATNTLPKVHLYALVSFTLLCIFYKSVFTNYISKKWFRGLFVFYYTMFTVSLIVFQGIYDYPGLPLSILAVIVIFFSVTYFYKVMVEAEVISLSKEPLIWINTAMLIYYTGNLFYHILFNPFLDFSHEVLRSLGKYNVMLNAIFYVLIAIGFYKSKRNIPTPN